MCGIVAAVADRHIVPVLLEGARKFEYRGHDSAGLAFIDERGLQRLRAAGPVAELTAQVDNAGGAGNTGITRELKAAGDFFAAVRSSIALYARFGVKS